MSPENPFEMWRQERVYQTSGCAYGRIDAVIPAVLMGSPVLVVRGWLLHEHRGLYSVRFRFQGRDFFGIPRLPREDVAAAFPGIFYALRSGFSVVLHPQAFTGSTEERILSFTALTFEPEIFQGEFPPLEVEDCEQWTESDRALLIK